MLFNLTPRFNAGAYEDADLESTRAAIRASARRWWILRTATMLVIFAAAMVFLLALRRDQSTICFAMRAVQPTTAALQAQVDRLGQLPAALPEVPARIQVAYASDVVREYARTATVPVIVGCTPRTDLVLHEAGNAVLVYQDGKLQQEWWDRGRFVTAWLAQEQRVKAWDQARRFSLPRLP